MGKFRVEIDENVCQGFGACVELCPKFFHIFDVDGKSYIRGGKKVQRENKAPLEALELDELECIRAAAEACPFKAIQITNLETGEELI